jgi:hypothetical protein
VGRASYQREKPLTQLQSIMLSPMFSPSRSLPSRDLPDGPTSVSASRISENEISGVSVETRPVPSGHGPNQVGDLPFGRAQTGPDSLGGDDDDQDKDQDAEQGRGDEGVVIRRARSGEEWLISPVERRGR